MPLRRREGFIVIFLLFVFFWTECSASHFKRRAEEAKQEVYDRMIHHAMLRSTRGMSSTSSDQSLIRSQMRHEASVLEKEARNLGRNHLHHEPLLRAARDLRDPSKFGSFMVLNHHAANQRH